MFTYQELTNLYMLLGTLDTCDQFGIPPKLTDENVGILMGMQRRVLEEFQKV
jgi:hypothetical protein